MHEKAIWRRYLWIAGVLPVLVAQTAFSRHILSSMVYVDFFLLFVVYHATTKFEQGGLAAGATAGLLQDCFSGGPLGVFGISKTVIGYALGALSRKFLLNRPLCYPVALAAASVIHDCIVFWLLNVFLKAGADFQPLHIFYRILWNALCGLLILVKLQWISGRRRQAVWR
jgi:rod shape-determining protein MreD